MSSYYGEGYNQGSQYYGAPSQTYTQSGYSSYQPPSDNSYNHDMQVAKYDDERSRYGDNPRSSFSSARGRDRYDDRRSSFSERERERDYEYDDRDRSRSRRRSSSRRGSTSSRGFGGPRKSKDHHRAKDAGATLVGGALGAFAGHELGHNGMGTTIGALAGAFAGHELEKHHEKKKERREFEGEGDRRSIRSRSVSRRRSVYEDDEDDEPRHHHHHRRDSDRYD